MFNKKIEDNKPKLNNDSKPEIINSNKHQKCNKSNQVTREYSLPTIKESPEDFESVNSN